MNAESSDNLAAEKLTPEKPTLEKAAAESYDNLAAEKPAPEKPTPEKTAESSDNLAAEKPAPEKPTPEKTAESSDNLAAEKPAPEKPKRQRVKTMRGAMFQESLKKKEKQIVAPKHFVDVDVDDDDDDEGIEIVLLACKLYIMNDNLQCIYRMYITKVLKISVVIL